MRRTGPRARTAHPAGGANNVVRAPQWLASSSTARTSPAGSKRAFVKGGRAVVVDDAKGSRPWKQEVTGAALEAMTYRSEDLGGAGTSGYLPPLEGPLEVSFAFYVARPKGHHGAQGLRPSAPGYPITRPDLLKLARAVEDALSGVVYRDDSQIVRELLEKHYGSPARVEVQVRELAPLEDGPEALYVTEPAVRVRV